MERKLDSVVSWKDMMPENPLAIVVPSLDAWLKSWDSDALAALAVP